MHASWKRIFYSFSTKSYIASLELITLLLTARLLGTEGRGNIATLLAWATLFTSFFGLSLHQVCIHKLSLSKNKSYIKDIFSSLFYISLITSILAVGLFIYIYLFSNNKALSALPENFFALGLILIPILIWQSYTSHLLIATDNLMLQIRNDVMGKTLGFLAMLIGLYWLDLHIYAPILSLIFSLALIITLSISVLKPYVNFSVSRSLIEARTFIISGLKLHINTIGSLILVSVDVIVIGYYNSMHDVGLYQTASQLIYALLIIPTAVTSVFFSQVTKSSAVLCWREHRKIITYIMIFMIFTALILFFISDTIFNLLFGFAFSDSVPVFNVLLIALVGMSFSQLMVSQWIGRGLFLQTGFITFTFAIANLVLNIIFIPEYGFIAAAWTTATLFSLSIITNLIFIYYIEIKQAQK